jgi:8-oxo-dGTP pyrophosphatase MutT (NUDIX family)
MSPGAARVPPAIDAILARFRADDRAPGDAGAAVLIVLRSGPSGLETLLIERAHRPGDVASGQVALPGGRVDGGDASLRATAMREVEEEVGLRPSDLLGPTRYVGTRTASAFGLEVAIFADALAPGARSASARSPTEVARVFWLPLSALARTEWIERDTSRGPIRVPATRHDGAVLWGFTRRVLRTFFELGPDPGDDARPPGPAS